jgi:hypothetical protein
MMNPMPSWRTVERHCAVRAARRARFSAGSRIPISTAMIPITTSSSTSVKPHRVRRRPERCEQFCESMAEPPDEGTTT